MDEFDKYANFIIDGLYLGSEDAGQVPFEILENRNITRICIPAFTGKEEKETKKYQIQIDYLQIYIADMTEFPIIQVFDEFHKFMDEAINKGESVLVHCAQGKSRSATIVISYVMKKYKWDFRQAYNFVREKRKEIATKFEDQLILWHSCNYSLQSENGTKNEVQKEIASKYPRSKFIKYL
eukprot:TRINITY_DN307_c0_g1_i3.p1 TRINITY_DN307_c0_g1~~TRINITY_DN307_c0_g1_i3.p1  ORF type:complete len:181 (-),score=35.41 TRINITY_DN307_c0_g1_i3:14-556(-)